MQRVCAGMMLTSGHCLLRMLSDRPERRVVEGSAVRPSSFPNSGVKSAEFSRRLESPPLRFAVFSFVPIQLPEKSDFR